MPAPDYAAEIASIELAMASGELRIEADGSSITYRSMSDMKSALAYYKTQARQASPTAVRAPSVTVASYSRD